MRIRILPISFFAIILQNLVEIEGVQYIEEADRQLLSQLLADWNRFRAQQQQQQTKPAAGSTAAPPPTPVDSQLKQRAMGMLQTVRYDLFISSFVLCWSFLKEPDPG